MATHDGWRLLQSSFVAAAATSPIRCPVSPDWFCGPGSGPERLEFVNPRSAGAAFLASTVSWRTGQISSRPRLQPLHVPPGTPMMAVVRLDSYGLPLPETGSVRAEILKAATIPGVKAFQVDFDARLSERSWYVLGSSRRSLNVHTSSPLGGRVCMAVLRRRSFGSSGISARQARQEKWKNTRPGSK